MTDKITKPPIHSLLLSLFIQGLLFSLHLLSPFLPLISLICISGAIALICRLNYIWIIFNILLPTFIYVDTTATIPPSLYLIAAIVLALFHLPAWWSQIPYYPTPHEVYDEISTLLPKDGAFTFLDIGCGVGKLLHYLSLKHPQGEFVGVEISLLPFLIAKMRNVSRSNVKIRFQSFWKIDFSTFNYLYAFLSPAPMTQLWSKVTSECKKGALFVTNSFKAPSERYLMKEVSPKPGGLLYIYQV